MKNLALKLLLAIFGLVPWQLTSQFARFSCFFGLIPHYYSIADRKVFEVEQ
jgi:hypothetical protein